MSIWFRGQAHIACIALTILYVSLAVYADVAATVPAAADPPNSAGWIEPTEPSPAPSGGWTQNPPPGFITPQSGHRSNVFYVGEPVRFHLSADAIRYDVRDYWGNRVDHGPAGESIFPRVARPGWYKLYVYGNNYTPQFGNILGTTTFVIFRKDPNFPLLNGLYTRPQTGGGIDFIQQAMQRVDSTVNFHWDKASPGPDLSNTNFAVIWSGQVEPQFSETYTFFTNSDDGVRLWIDGRLIINDWSSHGSTIDTANLPLIGGQKYKIRMEYFQGAFDAIASLGWFSPSTPRQIIPSGALYPTEDSVIPGGLTGTYYKGLASSDHTEDQVMRAVTAMGPERFNVDATDPAQAIASISADVEAAEALYMGRDSIRPRALMVAFTRGTENLASVKKIVEAYQNRIQYWEGQNEPNYSHTGAEYAQIEKAFYNTVKNVNPNLKVLGPATVTVAPGRNGLDWIRQFLEAGGGKYIDGFSFHAYNNVLGSASLARHSMNRLMSLLKEFDLDKMELWQTEQGSFAAVYGVYQPRLQGRWTMLQQMIFEQYGIPKEHNFIWYDLSHGFWDQPTWWENDDQSLNPAAPLMRVWSEELLGTKFSQSIDFGGPANQLYIGSLFYGPSKWVAAFMSAGQSDGQITLNVKGTKSTLRVVSAFGVGRDLPILDGKVQLIVPEIPVYVEMTDGQTISVVRADWGDNLALQAGATASYSGNDSSGIEKIINGAFEDWYDNGVAPWGDSNYIDPNGWVEISLPSVQSVSRVNIFSMRPWQLAGTLMDFEVQCFDDRSSQWVTVEHVKTEPRTFGVFSPVTRTAADTFFSDQYIFQIHFAPVQTSRVRLLIHQVSHGGGATQLVSLCGGQASSTPTLTISEIELFGK